jgi:hypothetical protein
LSDSLFLEQADAVSGEALVAQRRWTPQIVLRAGQPITPTLRLLRDILPAPPRVAV